MTVMGKICALGILVAAGAGAATINTTITVTNATANLATSPITVSGPATLTNIGSGAFSATVTVGASSITGNFTITLSGGAGTLTGTMSLPTTALTGSGSGTITFVGGTSSDAGTGSFAVTGNGSLSPTTGAITLSFTGSGAITTGGTTPPTTNTPTVTAVVDAGSYTSQIAEGSIFVVKGSNLSPAGLGTNGVLSFSFPLPTASNGVSIAFTPASGGSPTDAYLIYLYNAGGTNQLAAILPSSLAAGNYNVTVTNSGATSSPFAVAVVKSKPEAITIDSQGDGLAIVQNYVSASETDLDLYVKDNLNGETVSPAYPGQTLIAWATGLGPITSGDNTAAPVLNVAAISNVQVIVGGVTITPVFAGRAPGLAGEDQVDFVLPANVPTGCTVSFQISANGVVSAPTYIAIAPNAGSTACVQTGFTTSQLQGLQEAQFGIGSSASTLATGFFFLENFSETVTLPGTGPTTAMVGLAGGEFLRYTGFQLGSYATSNPYSGINGCYVVPLNATTQTSSSTSGSSASPILAGNAAFLDAGALTLTGPSGSNITNLAFTDTSNVYSLLISDQIPGLTIPGMQNNGTVIGGQYTLKGGGGKDVGPFTANVTLASPLTVTGGLPGTINRSAGLTLDWTGGNSSDEVIVVGLAATTSTNTTASGATYTETGAEFLCAATAGQGGITIPSSITQQLAAVNPTVTTSGSTGVSSLEVFSLPSGANGTFTAPLTAGGNVTASFLALSGAASTPIWQ
jgi:uncharacterized protein (TIGR03437 family)